MIASTPGVADIMICSLAFVFLMIITNCQQIRDTYTALHSDVLLFIVGTSASSVLLFKINAIGTIHRSFFRGYR
ncbi:MAG: hypothetical protein CSB32_00005 [Desulfobacterales bacterium]|nr:MAG: hypothetical protein CSB32_00005 [Desulfobacterales bacterium]